MAYKDTHRMFLQSFMSRGILNANDVFKLLESCCDKYGEVIEDKIQHLLRYLHSINDVIRVFGMEIRNVIDEVDSTKHYGLVNTTETSITLLASSYTENELEFFKKLISQIVLSDNGSIGSMAAVNIVDSLTKKMSKSDAEYLLERLIRDRWIGKSENGHVYIGTRGVLELEQYILEMFETAVRCNMCKKLCVQGESCSNCEVKIHYHCASKFFKDGSMMKCPECQNPWTITSNSASTSSSAAVGGASTESSPPSSSAASSSQSRKRKARHE
ncbi:non-structural maintenance of chromosomes element 1 homolog [Ruditapes philippinarum]|uniref:non-structural maintenance of chromosomes element 1 homolog n=1 Tax=Ruditapes philippinarum TaxID=129788 RepID=UPI00295A7C71|nr:non-structural maintenance of chromosomes element 1 homolog [Ruditapes philippinarum]